MGSGLSSASGIGLPTSWSCSAVLSANNLRAAKMAPVIGAAFKMAVPLIVIVPGLIALGLHNADGTPVYHLVSDSVSKVTGRAQLRPGAGR